MTDTEKTPDAVAPVATKPAAKKVPSPAAKPAVKAAAKAISKAQTPVVTPVAKKVAPKKASVRMKADAKPSATASKPLLPAVEIKLQKPKKIKMVRDSLSIPKLEYDVLDVLKLRAAKLGNPVKKTELIRAGIKAIAALSDSALLAAVKSVPSLKTGRPSKD